MFRSRAPVHYRSGGTSVLALGMSPTFSAFTASIQNSVNTAGTGALIMEETSGGVTCTSTDGTEGLSGNSAICATINNYGGTSNSKACRSRGRALMVTRCGRAR